MSFWTENFDSSYNQIDLTKNIENELDEYIKKSFLQIYESLNPKNPVKDFSIAIDAFKKGSPVYKNVSCNDDYENITISHDEEEDKDHGVFNSKIHSFAFELGSIVEKIAILTQKDFSIKLDISSNNFVEQCQLYKKQDQENNSYFPSMSLEEIYNSFFNQIHFNKINFFCDLISKYGKDIYIFIKKDNYGNIKEEEIYPEDKKDSIKNEISFQNLLKLNSLISLNTAYDSYEELERFCKRDKVFKSYFYKSLSELQKKQILTHIKNDEDESLNKRRL